MAVAGARAGRALVLPCPAVAMGGRGAPLPGLAADAGGFPTGRAADVVATGVPLEGQTRVKTRRRPTAMPEVGVGQVPLDLRAKAAAGAPHRLRAPSVDGLVVPHASDAAVAAFLGEARLGFSGVARPLQEARTLSPGPRVAPRFATQPSAAVPGAPVVKVRGDEEVAAAWHAPAP